LEQESATPNGRGIQEEKEARRRDKSARESISGDINGDFKLALTDLVHQANTRAKS
jgi:hypothetical protein